MKLPRNVRPGTRVDCNVKGRKFAATVMERTPTGLRVCPPRGCTYHHVTARQVTKLHKWDPAVTQITNEGE
jgi:hypothetical protein